MDLRKKILEDLEPSAARVIFSQKPLVLLCGGKVEGESLAKLGTKDESFLARLSSRLSRLNPFGADASSKSPNHAASSARSIRHQFFNFRPDFRIFRPEEITNWQHDGVFKNLMDFESELAGMCSLVVVVLESEGAIAELGAFSQLSDFKGKLIAIVSSEHTKEDSFISLGILRHVADEHPTSVKLYPWDIKFPEKVTSDLIQGMMEDIKEELALLKDSRRLSLSSGAHMIVIIYELVSLFVALKEVEILEAMQALGCEVKREHVRRKLFLLEYFGYIDRIAYSDAQFYTSRVSSEEFHRVRFALKSKGAFNPVRIRLDLLSYYRTAASEKNRFRAIRQAKIAGEI